jgi:hypothetical protein
MKVIIKIQSLTLNNTDDVTFFKIRVLRDSVFDNRNFQSVDEYRKVWNA